MSKLFKSNKVWCYRSSEWLDCINEPYLVHIEKSEILQDWVKDTPEDNLGYYVSESNYIIPEGRLWENKCDAYAKYIEDLTKRLELEKAGVQATEYEIVLAKEKLKDSLCPKD